MPRNNKPRRYVGSINALVDEDTRAWVDAEMERRGARQSDVVRSMLDMGRLAFSEGRRVTLGDGRVVLAVPLEH